MKNLINSYFQCRPLKIKSRIRILNTFTKLVCLCVGWAWGEGETFFSRNPPRDTAILAPSSLAEMCQTRKQCMVASEPRSKLNKMFKIQRNKIEFNSLLKKHLLDDVKESYTGTCSRLLCPQCHLNLN